MNEQRLNDLIGLVNTIKSECKSKDHLIERIDRIIETAFELREDLKEGD